MFKSVQPTPFQSFPFLACDVHPTLRTIVRAYSRFDQASWNQDPS